VIIKPHQSLIVKAWNTVGRNPSGPRAPEDAADALIKSAGDRAGLAAYSDDDVREPLTILLRYVAESNNLHPFGRLYLHQLLAGLIAQRARLVAFWKMQPEVLQQPVSRPIIILGFPRTGTSFLFNILAQDPAHRVLTNWEAVISQIPPKRKVDFHRDPRRRAGKWANRLQRHLAPTLRDAHEFLLDGPEECTPILMQTLSCLSLETLLGSPEFASWRVRADHSSMYRHHKRVLQTLQANHSADRWLLKSPDHTEGIASLMETYPDALFLHTHRDPYTCAASYASLNLAFRGIYMRQIDTLELGAQVMGALSSSVTAFMRQQDRIPRDQVINIRYEDLVGDPLATVQQIYERFGLPHREQAFSRIRRYLVEQSKRKSKHRYSAADFGITHDEVNRIFADYLAEFVTH
jgi:hypothetical protein